MILLQIILIVISQKMGEVCFAYDALDPISRNGVLLVGDQCSEQG